MDGEGGLFVFWLWTAPRRLRELGILGMNRRNAACVLDGNPRRLYPLVDDKLRMRDLCRRIGVATPQVYGVVACIAQLRSLPSFLDNLEDFVVKPARGSAGRGILVVTGRDGDRFLRHDRASLTLEDVHRHLTDILSGMFSL